MSALIPDNDAAPGYCSVATVPLTTDQIARIQQAATTGFAPGITLFFEKDLVGKGTRRLLLLDDDVAIVEYAGERKSKFVSKDAARFEAMVAGMALDVENIRKVVLLGVDGTICRRNTLSRLHGNSIIVMRCPLRT
jgi:hypothetical protein